MAGWKPSLRAALCALVQSVVIAQGPSFGSAILWAMLLRSIGYSKTQCWWFVVCYWRRKYLQDAEAPGTLNNEKGRRPRR